MNKFFNTISRDVHLISEAGLIAFTIVFGILIIFSVINFVKSLRNKANLELYSNGEVALMSIILLSNIGAFILSLIGLVNYPPSHELLYYYIVIALSVLFAISIIIYSCLYWKRKHEYGEDWQDDPAGFGFLVLEGFVELVILVVSFII